MNLLQRRPTKGSGLAAQGLHRNLVYTSASEVWAWYRIGPLPWSMRSLEERESSHASQQIAWAGLTGRSIHLRMTSVLFPRNAWASHFDQRTRKWAEPLDDEEGDLSWAGLLAAQQNKILTARLSQPFRAVGVKIPGVSRSDWREYTEKGTAAPDNPLHAELRDLGRKMAVPGFTNRKNPALSSAELWWLMHRSIALGVEPPATGAVPNVDLWAPQHLAEFTEPVESEYRAGDRTSTIRVLRDGVEETRHIATLNLIQLAPRATAEHQQPWLPAVDRFPFGVEVSAHLDVIDGRKLTTTMERLGQRARHIGHHARQSNRPEALAIGHTVNHAADAQHEVDQASLEDAARVYGVIRMAVTGTSEEEALDRSAKVTEYYAREQHMRLMHRGAQSALAREFIPGEPVKLNALDVERMPCAYWATSWPTASSTVGDGVGFYGGHTLGVARRAVMVEPHYPTVRHEQSSLVLGTGTLGSGKSALLGFHLAVAARRRHLVAVSDFDGRLARLADVPSLKPHTRVINLTQGEIAPGTLNPWLMIPEPTDPTEAKEARLARRSIAIDTMLRFLPASVTRMEGVRRTLAQAVTAVGSEYGTDPWQVIKVLEGEGATALASDLRENADSRAGYLVFGEPGRRPEFAQDWDQVNFTIITSPGLPNVPSTDPVDWDLEVQLSMPIRILGQYLLTRIARHPDRDYPKVLGFDEVGVGAQSQTYVNHIQATARTNRGNTTAIYLFSQDAADLQRLGVSNWASRWWLGRAPNKADAAIALSLAGLPADAGYEADVLPNLSRTGPGQFLYVDEVGQAEVTQVDYSWWPEVFKALERKRPSMEDQEWLAGSAA